jgi:hypothetical protein
MKYLMLAVVTLFALSATAQVKQEVDSITSEQAQQKIILDTKVKTSRSYLLVSASVFTLGVVSVSTEENVTVMGLGAAIAGMFTTPYHLVRHLIFVSKRNKFYKKYNIPLPKKQKAIKLESEF